MSNDEIVFGDVTYREPRRGRRPDLDRHWACIAYELPGPDDLPIFLDHQTADAIERHALRDTSVELGGILLGRECLDEETGRPFVWVTQSLEAKHYENTQASFTYTHDSWEEITRERDRLHPDLDIVGWYHTHPDFGIFLSHHDLFIHQHFFSQPLQVAYVVDPIRQARGFFQWRDGAMVQLGGFHLTADRADRLALARFVNDLEDIPNASSGGALSPRLEAELIAMLTRQSHPATVADRGQAAATFTLLGVVAGVLGLAAVLWLNTLTRQLQDQNLALESLGAALKKSDETRRSDVASARVEAKEAALDSLLREVRAGAKPGRFSDLYDEALRERDEARLALKKQEVNYESVFAANQALRIGLAAEKEKKEAFEVEAKRVPALLEKVSELKGQVETYDAELAEKGIYRKYTYAWYGALLGGIASLLLALGLVAALARPVNADEPGGEAPHNIT